MSKWSKFFIGMFVASAAALTAGDMNGNNKSNDMSSDMTGGMYIGGVVGPAGLNGAYKTKNEATGFQTQYDQLGNVTVIAGGLLGVEGTFWDWGYMALEGNVAYDSQNTTLRKSYNTSGVVTEAVKIENNLVYGGDAKLGVMFCNTALYVVGGVTAGPWKMKLTNDSSSYNQGIAPNTTNTVSKTKVSGKVGGGVRFPLCDQLKFDMQYSYNWFGTGSLDLTDSTGATYKHTMQYQQQKVLFSINWEFWNFCPEAQSTKK